MVVYTSDTGIFFRVLLM